MTRRADLWESLQTRWHELLGPFGVPGSLCQNTFEDLAARYGAPDRFYHNLHHLTDVLDVIDRLHHLAADPAAVRLAAWFHDAVYDSRAKDNEEKSAALAEDVLRRLGLPEPAVSAAKRLVLLTKGHEADDDPDGQVLLDSDLAILGAPAMRYDEYARAIRQEYAWVPENDFRVGRRRVLQSFLERPHIYHTEPMRRTHAAAARANLRREIESLG
jgi:predicted metal-dependent HD superfamily phosphohydrolase